MAAYRRPGLWLTSPAGWLPRTRISTGTIRSVIEYGLALPLLVIQYFGEAVLHSVTCCARKQLPPLPVPLLTPRTRDWFLSYEHTRAVHSTITEPNSSSWTPVWTGASGYVCPVLVERQPSRFRFDAANQVATRRLTGSSCRRSARVSSGHVLWILLYRDRSFVRLGNAADEKVTQGASKKEAVDFKRICQ